MPPFLADENFPHASIQPLRDAGYDVATVSPVDRGAPDADVLARARADGRILLTFDRDYGELIFLHGRPAPVGVVYFRTDPAHTTLPATILLALLGDDDLEIAGRFTTVEPDRVRQRPLPMIP
jgi:predicted nuclease of predicted toxin-antitoxin system